MVRAQIFNQESYCIQIIRYLSFLDDYATSYEIANHIGISRRLVRDEIINVQELLNEFGYRLISRTSKGYRIDFTDYLEALELINKIENHERNHNFDYYLYINRTFYVAKRLLECDTGIKIDDLAEEIFVSRSTLSKELSNLREWFAKHELKINSKANVGLILEGREENKRIILSDIIFINYKHSYIMFDFLKSLYKNKEMLDYKIISLLKKYNVSLSDTSLIDFLVYILVMISRAKSKHLLTEIDIPEEFNLSIEMQVAKEIALKIKDTINCQITYDEIKQIAIELFAKEDKGLFYYNKEMSLTIVNESLKAIENEFFIIFKEPLLKDLKEELFTMVDKTLFHCSFNTKQRNTYYNKVEKNYSNSFQLALCLKNIIEQKTIHHVSMSSISSFTILFEKFICLTKLQKQKVLFVCTLDHQNRDLLYRQLLFDIGSYVDIELFGNVGNILECDINQYDYIISTISMDIDINIPIVLISEFLDNNTMRYFKNLVMETRQIEMNEFLFNKKYYFNCVDIDNINGIYDYLYSVLKKEVAISFDIFKKNLLDKDQVEIIDSCSHSLIFSSHMKLNLKNLLIVFVLKNPIIYNKKKVSIIIFSTLQDDFEGNVRTQGLLKSLRYLCDNEQGFDQFINNPTYVCFIKGIKDISVKK